MTTPSFVNAGTPHIDNPGVTSCSPTMPGSLVAGNLLIAYVALRASGQVITLSGAGWTQGPQISTDMSLSIAYCVYAAQTSPTFTWGSATVDLNGMYQYTNTRVLSPIGNTHIANAAMGAGSTYSVPGPLTTANNATIVALITAGNNSSNAVGIPINYTDQDHFFNNPAVRLADGYVPVSGAQADDANGDFSGGSGGDWAGVTMELLGSGAAGTFDVRSSQVVLEVLRSQIGSQGRSSSRIIG